MKWEMEMEEIEAVLERIWDLHDKISDAIHAISRAHFVKSVKSLTRASAEKKHPSEGDFVGGVDDRKFGYVFVKGFRADEDAALAEARSLNGIRSALENLEDQLESLHMIQSQQQAERDAAIARLEQSRVILALKLSEHRGEKHKVIEEAQAFVSDVQEAGHSLHAENLFKESMTHPDDTQKGARFTFLQALITNLAFAKKLMGLNGFGNVLGNTTLFAVSMMAMLQVHRAALKPPRQSGRSYYRRRNESFQSDGLQQFDVYAARG